MKTALIGAGVIGTLHAKTMAALSRPFDAICDIDAKKAADLAAIASPDAEIYTDLEKLITDFKPDAVHICTPHVLHAPQVIFALEHGVNVLCEKPLCAHPDQLAGILEAEERSSATLCVCHQNRYNEAVLFAKEFVKDKKIVSGHGSVCWHRDEKYYSESPWRAKLAEAGGGVLINQALHTLDLLEEFCGTPEKLTARADILWQKSGVEVEDTVSALLTKDDGMRYTFYATTCNSKNLPVELVLRLEGGDVLLVLPKSVLLNGKTIFEAGAGASVMGKSYYGSGHTPLFADYYGCLEDGRKFAIDGKEGAKVMKLIFGVYASGGNEIKL
jgi:predicted dehydrogenase